MGFQKDDRKLCLPGWVAAALNKHRVCGHLNHTPTAREDISPGDYSHQTEIGK